jgi:FkbM family methyltransferase
VTVPGENAVPASRGHEHRPSAPRNLAERGNISNKRLPTRGLWFAEAYLVWEANELGGLGHPRVKICRMQPDLVFDVGAHFGNDTAYYLSRGFRVVAVDAHPSCCCALYRRFPEAVTARKLHILNFAIAEHPGLCTLLESDVDSQWNTIVPEVAAGKSGSFSEIVVPALTFDHVFERFNTPYYLKVDIEGSELSVFRCLVDRPVYISFEVGPDASPILQILRDLGYSRYKLVNQRLMHENGVSGTGPFGEETKGSWVDDKAIQEQLCATQIPGSGHPGDWFDIHAGL